MQRRFSSFTLVCLTVAIASVLLARSRNDARLPTPETAAQATVMPAVAPPDAAVDHAAAAPVDPRGLVAAAIRQLESRYSVDARFRHQIDLFGVKMIGLGRYEDIQPGWDHRYRLEIQLQVGQQESSLVQVCDGKYLWNCHQQAEDTSLTRIDVEKVLTTLNDAKNVPVRGEVGAWPGFGGLPRLLRGLHQQCDFPAAEPVRFRVIDQKGQTRQVDVWKILGRWKPECLADLLPKEKEKIKKGLAPDLSALPEHMPDHLLLFLGQENLFPLRLEYRRTGPGDGSATAPRSRALVVMDCVELNLNVPLDESRFRYQPGELKSTDGTNRFLKSLDLTRPQ